MRKSSSKKLCALVVSIALLLQPMSGMVLAADKPEEPQQIGGPIIDTQTLEIDDTEKGDALYRFQYSDGWNYSGSDVAFNKTNHYTNRKDATATIRFIGTQIKVYSPTGGNNGNAAYSIDGGEEAIVSLNAPHDTQSALVYESDVLEMGEHTLVIRNTAEGPGPHINVDKVEVINAQPEDWKLVWNDEFEGDELDRSKWDPWWCDYDGSFQFPEDSAIDRNMVSPDFYRVENGVVKIGNGYYEEPKQIGNRKVLGGNTTLITKYTYQQTYGYIETRFRRQVEDRTDGIAIWTMPSDGFVGLGGNGAEIDIIENGNWGDEPAKCNTIWNGYSWMHIKCTDWNATGIANGEFHTMGVDWTPEFLKFYYDGELVAVHSRASGEGIPQGPEFLILNGGKNIDVPFNYYEVDYVRCYQRDGEGYTGRKEHYEGNAVKNGGFEEKELSSWDVEGRAAVNHDFQNTGDGCAKLGYQGVLKQRLEDLVTQKKYRATAWVKLADPSDEVSLEVREYSISNQNKYFTPKRVTATGEGYQKLTVDFVMGSYLKTPEIAIINEGWGGVVYVDDVEVVQIDDLALHGIASSSDILDDNLYYEAQKAVDGYENTNADNASFLDTPWESCSTKWSAAGEGPHWLMVDLRKEQTIRRYQVRHAGAYEGSDLNTRDFQFQVSADGEQWTTLDTITGNLEDVTERNVEPTQAKYVRLYITNPQTALEDVAARIYEFSVFDTENPDLPTAEDPLKSIAIQGDNTVATGESVQLNAVIDPEKPTDCAIENTAWAVTEGQDLVTLSKETGASVEVKAGDKAGAATITATLNGMTATFTLTVKEKSEIVAVTGVTLNKESLTLTEGQSEALTATVRPQNADNKKVTWKSSDEKVATVDETGKVTAVAAGEAVITVTTAEGGFTADCAITVKAKTASGGEDPNSSGKPNDSSDPNSSQDGNNPNTNDSTRMILWVSAGLALTAALFVVLARKKNWQF